MVLCVWRLTSPPAGYKWLKYVPNGLLRTAQAAEWKVQAWMLGKPPTIAYEGIGFDLQREKEEMNDDGQNPLGPTSSTQQLPSQNGTCDQLVVTSPIHGRPSISSSVFSDYDDLRDFDGRFESQTTVGGHSSRPPGRTHATADKTAKRKASKSFLGKLKGGNPPPPSPTLEKNPPSAPRRLKALRSMGSLRGKGDTSSRRSSTATKTSSPSPQLPRTLTIDTGAEFGVENWKSRTPSPARRGMDSSPEPPPSSFKRVEGVRSVSLGTTDSRSPYSYRSPSPPITSLPTTPTTDTSTGASYDASLANALIAASHAESAKGAHNDLLLILNHDRVPWGFSYQDYPHTVAVWYGDKDERIAESAVKWLEQTMGQERCKVKAVRGADHGLMYNTTVVLDVFDKVHEYAKECTYFLGVLFALRQTYYVFFVQGNEHHHAHRSNWKSEGLYRTILVRLDALSETWPCLIPPPGSLPLFGFSHEVFGSHFAPCLIIPSFHLPAPHPEVKSHLHPSSLTTVPVPTSIPWFYSLNYTCPYSRPYLPNPTSI